MFYLYIPLDLAKTSSSSSGSGFISQVQAQPAACEMAMECLCGFLSGGEFGKLFEDIEDVRRLGGGGGGDNDALPR